LKFDILEYINDFPGELTFSDVLSELSNATAQAIVNAAAESGYPLDRIANDYFADLRQNILCTVGLCGHDKRTVN